MISFWVPGTPFPAGSKVYKGHRNGKPIIIDQCKGLPEWRDNVTAVATKVMTGKNMISGSPIYCRMIFFMPRPKSHFNSKGKLKPNAPIRCLTTPDLTKIVRAAEDSMSGIVFDDDSKVSTQDNDKYYAHPDVGPGVHVTVDVLKHEDEHGYYQTIAEFVKT